MPGGAPEGLKNGKAKVPFSVVEEIRDKYEYRNYTVRRLAAEYGQSINTINDWVYYRTRTRA